MKLNRLFAPTFITGTLGVLLLQWFAATPMQAAPPRHDRDRIPTSVTLLDSTSHNLVDSFETDLRRRQHGPARGSERRFLDAVRSLETASHTLRSDVETRQSVRRLQGSLYSVRSALNQATAASRDTRLTDRTRGILAQTRSLVNQVEDQKGLLFARAGKDRDDHDHDHRHDDDRRGKRGILGKLFGS